MYPLAVLLGILLLLVGLITYWLAPKFGPNPIFGVRVGYAFASREVWNETNRAGGLLMSATGLGMALAGLAAQGMGLPQGPVIAWVGGLTLAVLAGEMVWLWLYARKLALNTPAAREYPPVPFRWSYLVPVLASYALVVAVALALYPGLPERMATHFNLANEPDGWSGRGEFILGFLGLTALFPVLDLVIVLVAAREPVVALDRWGSTWRIDPQQGLVYTGTALALVMLMMLAILVDVAWFNLYGAHLYPLSWLLGLAGLLVIAITGLFFRFARREKEG